MTGASARTRAFSPTHRSRRSTPARASGRRAPSRHGGRGCGSTGSMCAICTIGLSRCRAVRGLSCQTTRRSPVKYAWEVPGRDRGVRAPPTRAGRNEPCLASGFSLRTAPVRRSTPPTHPRPRWPRLPRSNTRKGDPGRRSSAATVPVGRSTASRPVAAEALVDVAAARPSQRRSAVRCVRSGPATPVAPDRSIPSRRLER